MSLRPRSRGSPGITPRQVNKWCRGQAAVPVWAGLIAVTLLERSPEALALDLEEASQECTLPNARRGEGGCLGQPTAPEVTEPLRVPTERAKEDRHRERVPPRRPPLCSAGAPPQAGGSPPHGGPLPPRLHPKPHAATEHYSDVSWPAVDVRGEF